MAIYKIHEKSTGSDGLEFILSDATPDRYGDSILAEGWDLRNFLKNPIALFNHRADFPIGKWRGLRVERGALRGNLQLAPEGTSQRHDEIRKLVAAGILKSVSVGFQPILQRPREGGVKGILFEKQELVETSLVAIPANPNALAVAKSLGISGRTLDLVFARANPKQKLKPKPGELREQFMRRCRLTGRGDGECANLWPQAMPPKGPVTDVGDKNFLKLVEQEARFAQRFSRLIEKRQAAVAHLAFLRGLENEFGVNMAPEVAEALRNILQLEKQAKSVELALRIAQQKIRGGGK
jgi:HK97 family phage prohead protease